jgi:hypothetical protein
MDAAKFREKNLQRECLTDLCQFYFRLNCSIIREHSAMSFGTAAHPRLRRYASCLWVAGRPAIFASIAAARYHAEHG